MGGDGAQRNLMARPEAVDGTKGRGRGALAFLRRLCARRWSELRGGFQAWRWLVACCRHYRLRPAGGRDDVYTAAILADAAASLALPFVTLLALRGIARRSVESLLGGAMNNQTAEQAINSALALGLALLRAGRTPDAIRLAEHLGQFGPYGRAPDVRTVSAGLMASATGPKFLRMALGPFRWRLRSDAPFDLLERLATIFGRLPVGPASELAGLLLLVTLSIIDDLHTPASDRSLEGAALGLTPAAVRQIILRRPPPTIRDPGPADAIRLTSVFVENGYLYVLRSPGQSTAQWTTIEFRHDGKTQPISPGWIAEQLFWFHYSGRVTPTSDLVAPRGLLHALGGVVEEPLRLAGPPNPRRLLVLATAGTMHVLPFAALRPTGDRYLIEDYDIVHDDGLDALPRIARAPLVAAFWGGGLAGARAEVAQVRARARAARVAVLDAGGADPSALTLEAMRAACRSATVLHLATHFRSHPQDPLLGEFQLADDSWVSVREIVGGGGAPDLVFLSCCETGPLQNYVDGPGSAGPDPWRRDGARAVISTLWRVQDTAAFALADGFYAAFLNGATSAAALARAQAMMSATPARAASMERFFTLPGEAIDADASPAPSADPSAHPRAWAGYRLTGVSEGLA